MEVARRMYQRADDTQAGLAQFGLPAELASHFKPEDVDVYPENWPSLELFSALSTQWRIGMNGATGIDYTAIPVIMDLHGIHAEDRRARFDDLCIMERAAMLAMRDNK